MKSGILIADCGSTSCEWRWISGDEISVLPRTPGFNPNYRDTEDWIIELKPNVSFNELVGRVSQVFFYGAGCGTAATQQKVSRAIGEYFQSNRVVVRSDLWAAVHAFYRGETIICGILGTGANSCRFDGEAITHCAPSLGYILGDEGSGGKIGQLLLKAYYYREMPQELREKFAAQFNLDLDKQLRAIYSDPMPASHLAQFAKFAGANQSDPFIRELVGKTLREYLVHFVCGFRDYRILKVGLVGSVAYHFSEILINQAEALGITTPEIIQRPIDALANYHINSV